MKTINLEEILRKNSSIWNNNLEVEDAIAAMKDACEQTVDLCAENLRLWLESETDDNTSQQTILNTKNQIV